MELARKQMQEIITREGVWSAVTSSHTFSPPKLDSVRHGQLWRLFTPMLLHFGVLHLAFNMWWLYSLGGILERRSGTLFLLLLVLTSQVVSALAQYYWGGPLFGGMSGVIYALFGYVWIRGKTDPRFGLEIPQQTVLIMLAWLVLCMTGALGAIANAAHLSGLIVGVTWAAIPRGWHNYRRWQRQP
jgi:rhomboid protease GlpG